MNAEAKIEDDLYENAPVWLAQLADEVERLRAEQGVYYRYLCTNGHHSISRRSDLTTCSAKTMTWTCHAPMVPYDGDETLYSMAAERDAALAECERLRAEVDGLLDELSRCQCERVGDS